MRSIGFVTGSMELRTSELRLDAFIKITKELNIYDEDLIYESSYSVERGVAATNKLLDLGKKIDAIIFCSDVMAFGGIKALKKRNIKVFRDIAVIGYDDIAFCEYVEPELTTIRQPIYQMGSEACKLLINIINNKVESKRINLKSQLIIRGTA